MRLHGVHDHIHLCQLCHYRWVRSGKDCIGLSQSFQLVALCLHPLQNRLYVFFRLMVLFWRGRWCTVDVLHCWGVPPFSWSCYRYFMLSVSSVKEQLVILPRLEVVRLSSPIADVVVEHPCLCQNGDPFGHHHWVEYCLASCLREFYPLFQMFNKLGKRFRRVVGPHHLYCIFLEVDLVDHPVSGKYIL